MRKGGETRMQRHRGRTALCRWRQRLNELHCEGGRPPPDAGESLGPVHLLHLQEDKPCPHCDFWLPACRREGGNFCCLSHPDCSTVAPQSQESNPGPLYRWWTVFQSFLTYQSWRPLEDKKGLEFQGQLVYITSTLVPFVTWEPPAPHGRKQKANDGLKFGTWNFAFTLF